MPFPDTPPRPLLAAIAVSLAVHGLLLWLTPPERAAGGAPRLEAQLARPAPREAMAPVPPRPAPPARNAARKQPRTAARPRLLTADKSRGPAVPAPKWTAAEKADMDGFLNELAGQAAAVPKPSLAQRALAMAQEQGRQLAQQDAAGEASLELRPDGPPADPFSLDLYMDGLLRRLNRSAAFVRNDPRSKGVRSAAVRFRLDPDGRLKSFVVLNAGDQADEIAFIKAVVERSAPFSPFPPDIDRAARSLGVTICIQPGGAGGFGFSRMSGGRGC